MQMVPPEDGVAIQSDRARPQTDRQEAANVDGVRVDMVVIAARAANGVVGFSGKLPWRMGADLAHFKAATMGAPMVMGRVTWEGLPQRPLPGRRHLVLTRDRAFLAPGAFVVSDFTHACAAARAMAARMGAGAFYVIGGPAIWAMALPLADKVLLTEIEASPQGDAFFPGHDLSGLSETGTQVISPDARNQYPAIIRTLERL